MFPIESLEHVYHNRSMVTLHWSKDALAKKEEEIRQNYIPALENYSRDVVLIYWHIDLSRNE